MTANEETTPEVMSPSVLGLAERLREHAVLTGMQLAQDGEVLVKKHRLNSKWQVFVRVGEL